MKNILAILCIFISIGSLFAMLSQNQNLAHHPMRLTFSVEGCQLAKNIGLRVQQNNNECTAIARFSNDPSGGSVRLDNDQIISISNTSLLAWRATADQVAIADTAEQNNAWLRLLFFMALALFSMMIMMILVFYNSKKSPKKSPSA